MKVLIVEDEVKIQRLLAQSLKAEGWASEACGSAELALPLIEKDQFDAFVLDVMLPGQNGMDFCRFLRDKGVKQPILLLTAKSTISDKVEGLDAGADDYLTKPFEIEEFKARIRALFRKAQNYPRDVVQTGDLTLDPNSRVVMRAGKEIILSRKESQLLEYLMRHEGQIVTRAMIAKSVWDSETTLYTNVIDVFVNRLRKKIDEGQRYRLIQTVRGKGFVVGDMGPQIEDSL